MIFVIDFSTNFKCKQSILKEIEGKNILIFLWISNKIHKLEANSRLAIKINMHNGDGIECKVLYK